MNSVTPVKDISDLRARRREARRARYLLRRDIGLGVLIAAVALLFAPGVGILAVVALLILVVCLLSLVIGKWRTRRG
jgi:hypothetical protein